MAAPDFTSARWRKSTYSNEANACVEVASTTGWRKSKRSQGENACVEVALAPARGRSPGLQAAGP
ncbi:DUF397 domain-containing protein [Saccharopolyspora shandongensis]|uniref:DUF397 domain-containing protein n=1 Tax=Saccharopolyspora shandongensis TaxID=418495 RepID=UPI000B84F5FC|nr:DUF397 domain-containing protein [Saccharopolyspora shandongensis]